MLVSKHNRQSEPAEPTKGATKNAARIAELEAEIEQLKKDDAPPVEYPKWIPDATDPTGQRGTTVASRAEEDARRASSAPVASSADEKLRAAEIADAAAPAAPGVQKVQIVNSIPAPFVPEQPPTNSKRRG